MVQILDRFLAALDVGVAAFTSCDVRNGWRLVFAPNSAASVHYCLAGAGTMRIGNGPPVTFEQHSFVLIPPKLTYSFEAGTGANAGRSRLMSRGSSLAPPFKESIPTILAGDGEEGLLTACGEIRFAPSWTADLLVGLAPILERFTGPDELKDQFVMLLAENAKPRIGTRALTEALLRQCLVLLFRRKFERSAEDIPWIAALADRRLAAAMTALHDRPSEAFTVEALARIAGMSRSAFASLFKDMLGRPPMSLLKELRLRRAGELLTATALPVADVAHNVGFSSRSHFSHAFRKLYGIDPSAFRAARSQQASKKR
jgi:AraC family transcriptional regulator, activator of mtrCDE